MKNFLLAALCFSLLCAPDPRVWALDLPAPQVVVSIKPIHALVAGVMQGVGEPQLLVRGGGSPHGYVLRPSEARMLASADLVIWVGPALENFLQKPLATLARDARQLELVAVLADQLLPLRQGGGWDPHTNGHDEHGDHHASIDGCCDPHLWLSPLLAKQVVAQISLSLSSVDPEHGKIYQRNALELQQRLDRLHEQLAVKLAPVKELPYIVFHDAYRYFESAYGLQAVGSVTLDPERRPGARRIGEIRAKISALGARCVFTEPQFEPRLVAAIIEGTSARTGHLDPLGADLPEGLESYFLLLNNMADNLLEGLR